MPFDQYKNPMNRENPTICIPRVENHISREYIRKRMTELRLGEIIKITETPLRSEEDYKRVFIKVRWNPLGEKSNFIYNRLKSGENIKLVYDSPWYWKLVASR